MLFPQGNSGDDPSSKLAQQIKGSELKILSDEFLDIMKMSLHPPHVIEKTKNDDDGEQESVGRPDPHAGGRPRDRHRDLPLQARGEVRRNGCVARGGTGARPSEVHWTEVLACLPPPPDDGPRVHGLAGPRPGGVGHGPQLQRVQVNHQLH